MLARDIAAFSAIGRGNDRTPPVTQFASRRVGQGGGGGLAALADTPLASRFCTWNGRSGQRYVFSVYPAPGCPAFRDALLLAVVRDRDGRRRAVSICDTGPFPESILSRVERDIGESGGGVEFHLHLLARSRAERSATLLDLDVPTAPSADAVCGHAATNGIPSL